MQFPNRTTLNLRAAFLRINPSLEETGRSLGLSNWQVFRRVTIPLFSPAFFAGSLLVGLHVLGDFGTVSLMRYETFSYALYLQYIASFDHIYSAWLALILLLITVTMLVFEARFLKGLRFHHIGRGTQKQTTQTDIGRWRIVGYAYCLCVLVVSVLLPAGTIIFWLNQGAEHIDWAELLISAWNSFSASAPAAILTIVFALPLAYMGVRYSSRLSGIVQRIAYIGYAIPGLAFALGWLFVALKSFPGIYQTLLLLIFTYTFHFLAEAVGPIRTALYQAKPELEEAALSLGYSRWKSFLLTTLPPIRRGVIVSMAFVFLSAMKELSITFVLSPLGRETLAVNVWGYIDEAMFSEAAPFALAIFSFSAIFMGLLFIMERRTFMRPLLRVEQITKRFLPDQPPAIEGVSFDVQQGQILALLGPSGCGKTTVLRIIAGFEHPDVGRVFFEGRELTGPKVYVPPEARHIGFVFQDYALFPHLNVLENVMFGLHHLPSAGRLQRANEVLEMTGLGSRYKKRRPYELSGGEQQRVALARSLAPSPKLILLDESFNSLDAGHRIAMQEEVRGLLKQTGTSAILVTHDQEEALYFADYLAVMDHARLIQKGTPEEVYHYPTTAFVASFLGRTNLIRTKAYGSYVEIDIGKIPIDRPVQGDVLLSIRPEHLSIHPPEPGSPTGQVIARDFKGNSQNYRVRVGGEEFLVHTAHQTAFSLDEQVTLSLTEPAKVIEPQE